jgi:amino acid transporter
VAQGYATGGPVQAVAITHYTWTVGVSGIMNMTYAYAGANMFVEFMNEMKNPKDFWKSQLSAQLIIMFCYILYGALLYHYQGEKNTVIIVYLIRLLTLFTSILLADLH